MKTAKTVLFGILVTAVALSALVSPAAAYFVHDRGILISTYPQEIVVFWDGPGYYQRTLAIAIRPPWYFVEDLMGFDSLTLTITLLGSCPSCGHSGDAIQLLGADKNGQIVAHWSGVVMEEEDNGALLLYTITFVITSSTGSGYYWLDLQALAYASEATFMGWDQIPFSIYPGLYLGA